MATRACCKAFLARPEEVVCDEARVFPDCEDLSLAAAFSDLFDMLAKSKSTVLGSCNEGNFEPR